MAQQTCLGTHATTVLTMDREGIYGNDTIVTYHNTHIVIFNNVTISLDSGGYRTATTKTRMNQASNQFKLGYRVFQKDFKWFVILPDDRTVEFTDGITFIQYKKD